MMPTHVAIIMDGNGRWAQSRGLERQDGHKAGAHRVRAITEACIEHGIEVLTVYAFQRRTGIGQQVKWVSFWI